MGSRVTCVDRGGVRPGAEPRLHRALVVGLENAQIVALWAAFWTAVLTYRRCNAGQAGALRFVLALVCGAALAHVGWALLHLPRVVRHATVLLDPSRGFTLLLVPLGAFVAVPWRRPLARDRFLASALRAMPLAFAVARLGCLAVGCCGGVPVARVSMSPGVSRHLPVLHPTALYEVAGFILLHTALRRSPDAWVSPAFAFGFGAIRLAIEPLRATPPLGAPAIPAVWLAAVWLAASIPLAGRSLRLRRRSRGLPCVVQGVRTERRASIPGQEGIQQHGAELPHVSRPRT